MPKYKKKDQIKIAEAMYKNGVLKNKKGIHNQAKLTRLDYTNSTKKSNIILKHHHKITNIDQLKDIHNFMFKDVYSWAGKVRNFDISKNHHNFLPHSVMNNAEYNINQQLKAFNHKKSPTTKDYAKLLDNINEMHPFREGNGRSSKCFLQNLSINKGQFLQYNRHSPQMTRGLNKGNINMIAKNMTASKINSPASLNVQLYYQNHNQLKSVNTKVQKAKKIMHAETKNSKAQNKSRRDIISQHIATKYNKASQSTNRTNSPTRTQSKHFSM